MGMQRLRVLTAPKAVKTMVKLDDQWTPYCPCDFAMFQIAASSVWNAYNGPKQDTKRKTRN